MEKTYKPKNKMIYIRPDIKQALTTAYLKECQRQNRIIPEVDFVTDLLKTALEMKHYGLA